MRRQNLFDLAPKHAVSIPSIKGKGKQMRVNLPVSNVEYPIYDDTLIVSTTDLKGRITYVNPTFCEVSGFTKEELIGPRLVR